MFGRNLAEQFFPVFPNSPAFLLDPDESMRLGWDRLRWQVSPSQHKRPGASFEGPRSLPAACSASYESGLLRACSALLRCPEFTRCAALLPKACTGFTVRLLLRALKEHQRSSFISINILLGDLHFRFSSFSSNHRVADQASAQCTSMRLHRSLAFASKSIY